MRYIALLLLFFITPAEAQIGPGPHDMGTFTCSQGCPDPMARQAFVKYAIMDAINCTGEDHTQTSGQCNIQEGAVYNATLQDSGITINYSFTAQRLSNTVWQLNGGVTGFSEPSVTVKVFWDSACMFPTIERTGTDSNWILNGLAADGLLTVGGSYEIHSGEGGSSHNPWCHFILAIDDSI